MSNQHLPDKLWLKAFQYLRYHDLKRRTRVCKRFNNIAADYKLDGVQFRVQGLFKPTERTSRRMQIHPAFRAITYDVGDKLKNTFFIKKADRLLDKNMDLWYCRNEGTDSTNLIFNGAGMPPTYLEKECNFKEHPANRFKHFDDLSEITDARIVTGKPHVWRFIHTSAA